MLDRRAIQDFVIGANGIREGLNLRKKVNEYF